jgi:hypothetical protein
MGFSGVRPQASGVLVENEIDFAFHIAKTVQTRKESPVSLAGLLQ